MTHINARIYGPPTHTPNEFSVRFLEHDGRWSIDRVWASSPTRRGTLWSIGNVVTVPEDENAHLLIAAEAYALISDMVQSRPSTEERARFVADGGIYGRQEPLF